MPLFTCAHVIPTVDRHALGLHYTCTHTRAAQPALARSVCCY